VLLDPGQQYNVCDDILSIPHIAVVFQGSRLRNLTCSGISVDDYGRGDILGVYQLYHIIKDICFGLVVQKSPLGVDTIICRLVECEFIHVFILLSSIRAMKVMVPSAFLADPVPDSFMFGSGKSLA
jgi:hypothetical protein